MKEFEEGAIVKSNHRSDHYPLFLIVTEDSDPSPDQFNAVVLFNKEPGPVEEWAPWNMPGRLSNSWNKPAFDVSSWDELKRWI